MTGRAHLRAEAPGLAALPPGAPERAAAWAHASGCEECARALREAERLQALVAGWEAPPLPAAALEWAARGIGAELRREAWRRAAGSVAAAGAVLAALVGMARDRSRLPEDWGWAAALGALALALAAAARRRGPLAVAAAALAAGIAAAATGHPGPLAADVGVECLALELGSAAAVVGAVWLALRGGTTSPARAAVAAAAAAGALAGYAGLQVTCAARSALPHLLAFHAGGVLVAVVVAALVGGAPGRPWPRGAGPG